jgi:site-specific DNA recombinase
MAAYGKTETGPPRAPRRPAASARILKKGLESSIRPRNPEEWILIPVPAIVSEELFDAAQRRLAGNRAYRKDDSPYLLQGLTVCACCSYAVWGIARGSRRRYRYYVCSGTESRRFGGQAVCSMRSVRADALEEHVWDSVRATVEHPDRVLEEWNRRATETDEDDPARRQLSDCEQTVRDRRRVIERLQDAYEAGALTLDELTHRVARARGGLATAESERTRVAAILDSHRELRLLHAQLGSFAERVRGELETLDSKGRRHLIRLLVDRIEVDDPGVTIVYRIPPTAQPPEGGQPVRRPGFVGSVHGAKTP